MNWRTAFRSYYDETTPEPDVLRLDPAETAVLSIDAQNVYLKRRDDPVERARWEPFQRRMRETVIPAIRSLQDAFRARGIDVIHARIACLLGNGRDRSLSQKKPGWNYLLLPKDAEESQIVPEVDEPRPVPRAFGRFGVARLRPVPHFTSVTGRSES